MATRQQPSVNGLDLDAVIAEGPPGQPYTFSFAGQTYTAMHPRWIDWQEAIEFEDGDFREVVRLYLGDEQFAEFSKHRAPSAAVRRLVDDIERYYKTTAAEAQGEDGGLPTS